MTLSARLSTVYLGGFALALAGFAGALQWLASEYLRRQVDERLEAAVNTLVAAAEVDVRGVEWEPAERRLVFGRLASEDRFFWKVSDPRGLPLDRSEPLDVPSPPEPAAETRGPITVRDRAGGPWRVLRRTLSRPRGPGSAPPIQAGKYERLTIVVGVSLAGSAATLRTLGLSTAGLSLGLWTLATVSGRSLSRGALRPLSRMAEAARAIDGNEPGERLPVPRTLDEIQGLGDAFNALLDRLQDSSERQRRFAGDASHQLRTPLTAIQGQVDLALRQDRDVETYQRTLSLIQKRTRHLRQIVDALLFLARADAEANLPDLEPVALDAWIMDHIQGRPASPAGASVRVRTDPEGPFVALVHPALLGELLDNLLENAEKHGRPGTPITVRLSRAAGSVLLAVEDQGPGIPEADLARLFEPFYRAEAARRRGEQGLGLGLSVAQRLARRFGGTIEVRSRPGLGSTFTLRLPDASGPDPHRPTRDEGGSC